jgi:isoleucyl-tRNA synthetase
MNIEYRPNYKEVGKIFGSNMKDFANYLANISSEDIDKLNNNSLTINLNGTEYKVTTDMIDTRISSKEGYDVAVDNNKFIILNTELTKDLINEGLARETISKIQQLRKSNDFEVTDRITIYYEADDDYVNGISDYLDFIKNETLGVDFIREDNIQDVFDINDYKVGLRLERINK